MNEMQLSDSLPVIETEIRQYQNLAGESIFEIGRRLKHVKENDLAHGEWSEWLKKMNMDRTQAHKFIKVSEEFSNVATSQQIGMNVLYEIATLPEPERTKEHVTSKGEVKMPDEMTVKELRELKKQLKEREQLLEQSTSQLETTQRENELLHNKLEQAENIQPEVIEKEIIKEVIPEDIKQQVEEYKAKVARESKSAESLRNELKKYTEAFSDPQQAYDEKEERRLERESNINAYKLAISIQKFIENNAVETYKVSSVIRSNETAKQRLQEHVDLLKDFTDQLESILNARIITK